MTTSRVIRGTRAKVFLYICALLIIVGIIACYNNTLSQLDDVKKSNDICHQQEENLSTQLQVISDYKQRLEKSLKNEKAEHQHAITNLENQLKEERSNNDKYSSDTKMKLASLQQHFNLLQTEYDDFKEETGKAQKQQQEEINTLEAKLKEVQEELKKVKASKESLKSQYIAIQIEKERLQKEVQEGQNSNKDNESTVNHLTKENNELKRELEHLKEGCPRSQDTLPEPKAETPSPNYPKLNQPETNVLNAPPESEKQDGNNVLAMPVGDNRAPSSSSSTKAALKPSQGSLIGARPILLPTVTPASLAKKMALKVPETGKQSRLGVGEHERKENQNEQPEIFNARYQNARESANENVGDKAVREDIDKDNGAHEVFDAPLPQNGFDSLPFADNNLLKHPHFEKKHIDSLLGDQDQPDYKDMQNDVQLGDNEEDDDADGYDDRLARQKDPAVRN